MLQAENVPLNDKEAIASYIQANLDEVVEEIGSAKWDTVNEELLGLLLEPKTKTAKR